LKGVGGQEAATTQEVSVAIAEAGGARSDAAVAFMPAYVRAAIAAAVLPAIRGLDDERARFYGDLVLTSLNDAARRTLETMPASAASW